MNTILEQFKKVQSDDVFLKGSKSSRLAYSFHTYGIRAFYWFSYLFPFTMKVRSFFGKKLLVNLPDNISIALYGSLLPMEDGLLKYVVENIRGGVFYDVGAHLGFYSALAETLGASVHSFEANPRTCELLKKNVNGTVNCVAVSSAVGTADFYADLKRMVGYNGFSEDSRFTKITVPTQTLDEYVKTHPAPDFIKIDVEGSELGVLQGAVKTLHEYHPTIAMEIWDESDGEAERLLIGCDLPPVFGPVIM